MTTPLPSSGTQLDRLLTLGHFSLDSYSGTPMTPRGDGLSPVDGWSVLLSTEDFLGSSSSQVASAPMTQNFQATAYRNDITGEVIVAYRGTDEDGELLGTSIPLGAGLDESTFPITTTSYMQDGYNFLTAVIDEVGVVNRGNITLTGHSLGGIVAGVLGAMTHIDAVTFDSGPHNKVIDFIRPLLDLEIVDQFRTPDSSYVENVRVTGEVLTLALEAAQSGPLFLEQVLSPLTQPVSSALLAAINARFSDAARIGTIYNELDAGEQFTDSVSEYLAGLVLREGTDADIVSLHSMALLQLLLQGNEKLGLNNFNDVSGFLRAFYDETLAQRAGFGSEPGADTRLFEGIVKSILDDEIDVASPLLQAVDSTLHLGMDADYGAFETSYNVLPDYHGPVARLAELLVHYAGQQLTNSSAFDSSIVSTSGSGSFVSLDLTKLSFDASDSGAIPRGLDVLWSNVSDIGYSAGDASKSAFYNSDTITIFTGSGDGIVNLRGTH